MDQYIGKMLDNRYEILELIGSGGMANVYKAKCHRLNRLVAIKILKSDLADNAESRRRFRDESQAVAQLSHANIVSVYDVSKSDGLEYIVMELIDGITLKQYMERRGQMDWREALHFISQILRGISHAHSRGIIHRDIKPHNIMILRDGSVKVADFGIACLANAGQTLTQEALGSVHYISPEQARGDRTDVRSDIYSAGVVLYEMLTGRLPFEGDSAVSVAIQHLSSIPLSPRDINENVPEALELICMKAMNANPDKRYATADEMLEDLEKFRKDPTVDMTYISQELAEHVDDQPTQPIAVAEVISATRGLGKKKSAMPEHSKKSAGKDKAIDGREKKRLAFILAAFTAAMIMVFLIFKLIFGGFSGGKTEDPNKDGYVVPDLLGKTVEQAQMMPEIKDIFTITVAGSREDENYQPGQIISQDPAGGRTRKNNRVITVYICAEARKEALPYLIGSDEQAAKLELNKLNLNLQIEVKEEFSEEQGEGLIISTTPAAGESIKKGDLITLVVSKGLEKKPVTVPSFTGMDIDSAAWKAESMGLAVGEHRYEFSEKQEGSVIGQSIETTTTVEEGTEIVFTVSKGPEPVQRVSKTVSFTIPNGPEGFDGNVYVSIIQDGEQIKQDSGSIGDTISCTVSGDVGTSCKVEAYFTYGSDPDPDLKPEYKYETVFFD